MRFHHFATTILIFSLAGCSSEPDADDTSPDAAAIADGGTIADDMQGPTDASLPGDQDMTAIEDAGAEDASEPQDMSGMTDANPDAAVVPDEELVSAVLNVVNSARGQEQTCGDQTVGPVGSLVAVTELSVAAQSHANDMAARGTLSFEGSDGSTSGDRVAATGWSGTVVNESISAGQSNALVVVSELLGEEGTCMNLMAESATALGAGSAEAASDPSPYWSIVLGIE